MRFVTEQVLDRVGHVIDVGEATQRAAADNPLALFAAEVVRHVGRQKSGRNSVHIDAMSPTSRASERVKPIIDALVAA